MSIGKRWPASIAATDQLTADKGGDQEMLPASVRRLRPDTFVMALAGTVTVATLLPCQGTGAQICHAVGLFAIASLFFLQGARLSRESILAGMTNWKLHASIAGTTFALFPILGTVLIALMPHALDRTLVLGVLFLCALPSTVQSSIALTSIARGNVAGAVCAATASSLIGMVFTPLLFGFMSHVRGGGIDVSGMWQVFAELLLPFAAGHLLRPWIGPWAARNKALLAITDRGSILVVVYTAFSAAVMHGIWHEVPPVMLGALAAIVAALLATGLLITRASARAFGLSPADEVAVVFCGSQKSLVAGIPIASVLFAGPALGVIVLPIMIYHPLQLVVCAWLARRYANRPIVAATAETTGPLPVGATAR
jgi:solute carrier family 10 (sodium/bile acid cotransporter), member 7